MDVITFSNSWGIFFNVSNHVGHGRTNSLEDVQLVQLMIRKIAQKPLSNTNLRNRMMKVPLNGKCDKDTVDAIRAIQEHVRTKSPGTIVDGWISPAGNSYLYGAGQYTIIELNSSVRKRYPNIWPRLQDFPECSGRLRSKIPEML